MDASKKVFVATEIIVFDFEPFFPGCATLGISVSPSSNADIVQPNKITLNIMVTIVL
jgi:hypothetical protein